MEPSYTYKARVTRVVDGDTLDLDIDLGFNVRALVRARLHGINTPEIHGVKKSTAEYRNGMKAKEFVEEWLDESNGMTFKEVVIRSHDGLKICQGKYGRWIVEVYPIGDVGGGSLNEALVRTGHADLMIY